MKVVRKTRRTVAFCDLEVGGPFEKSGNVYLKITHEKKMPNAVVLSGCYKGEVVTFVEDVSVIPITVELHVFDKGENT